MPHLRPEKGRKEEGRKGGREGGRKEERKLFQAQLYCEVVFTIYVEVEEMAKQNKGWEKGKWDYTVVRLLNLSCEN